MEIGKKLVELRKKKELSQESLAELIGVSRQTISKWELGDTYPDINQAKKLSKLFDVSLDELVDNDVKNIIVEKVNNTEKLVKITIIFMKSLVVLIILAIIGIIALFTFFNVQVVESNIHLRCLRNTLEFRYDIIVNDKAKKDINDMNVLELITNDKEFEDYLKNKDYKTANELIDIIRKYNNSNDGICE